MRKPSTSSKSDLDNPSVEDREAQKMLRIHSILLSGFRLFLPYFAGVEVGAVGRVLSHQIRSPVGQEI